MSGGGAACIIALLRRWRWRPGDLHACVAGVAPTSLWRAGITLALPTLWLGSSTAPFDYGACGWYLCRCFSGAVVVWLTVAF